jgi:hypothetical protein
MACSSAPSVLPARAQAKLTLANLAYNFDQGSEMLTHQALEMLKRRTGLTKAQ